MKYKLGLSLLELMLALAIGTVLMGTIVQLFNASKASYRITEEFARLQENTRTSLSLLASDIRMAGLVPCGKTPTSHNLINTQQDDWWGDLLQHGMRAYDGDIAKTELPLAIRDQAIVGSDVLIIYRAGSQTASVDHTSADHTKLILKRKQTQDWLEDGSLIVVCDAFNTTLFQASDISHNNQSDITIASAAAQVQPGNTTDQIDHDYTQGAQVAHYEPSIYFIAQSVSEDGYSLFREYLNISKGKLTSRREELVTGVENMQLQFGLDLDAQDGIADAYFSASHIDDYYMWDAVLAVKVGLLFASEDGVRKDFDNNEYVLADTLVSVNKDKRKRYINHFVVSVRN